MNTNPTAKVVLCYGDSNTWGQNDDQNGSKRRAVNERWTGIIQNLLGDDFSIVEEGLQGRTTDLDHYNPAKPSRSGFPYFQACLPSHSPVDIVIIMLGTNDMKIQYNRSVAQIADAHQQFITTIRTYQPSAVVIVISPAHINSSAPTFSQSYNGIYDETSMSKSTELAPHLEKLTIANDCHFIDASKYAKAGIDGIHFDAESHHNLAHALRDFLLHEL